MVELLELTAPDGGLIPAMQPSGRWPWVVFAIGAALVALGGTLLGHDADVGPASPSQTSVTQQAVP